MHKAIIQPHRSSGALTGRLLLFGIASILMSCKAEPRDYPDCILTKIKAGMSEEAVQLVETACAQKFPPKNQHQPEPEDLIEDLRPNEIEFLDGRGGVSLGNHFAGTLYNGTAHMIKEVTIAVTTVQRSKEERRLYRVSAHLAPQSAGDFGFDIIVGDKGADYEWFIVAAKGVRGRTWLDEQLEDLKKH